MYTFKRALLYFLSRSGPRPGWASWQCAWKMSCDTVVDVQSMQCKNYAFNLIFEIYDLGSDGFSMQGKQIAANTAAVDSLDRTLDGT